MISKKNQPTGATLAGIFSLALMTVLLLCGAGNAPIENFAPQGAMQSDLNAGGHNVTNAATISATNVVVSGSLTAPAGFTLPYTNVTGAPASGLQPANNLADVASALASAQNLGVNFSKISAKSADFTVAASDRGTLFEVTTGTGNIKVTLPTAAAGFFCAVRKADTGAGTITVNGALISTSGHVEEIFCDGTTFQNRYVGGSIGADGSFTHSLGGTVSGDYLSAQDGLFAPNIQLPVGPAAGNVIWYGDSLVAGGGAGIGLAGGSFTGLVSPYTGGSYSPVDSFASTLTASGLQCFNLGISQQTTANGDTQYGANSGSTAVTFTVNSTTATVTGPTTGMSGTMAVFASGKTPYATTATLSGTTLTLSQAATASGSATLNFATSYAYGLAVFNASAHVLSNSATGVPTWFFMEYGTNDYYVNGVTSSGTATTGNGTISAMSINQAVSGVGTTTGGAVLTSKSGYNAWGLDGTGKSTYLGTVSSSTSTSITVSNAAAVNSAMTTFKITPPLTAWQTSYQSVVNKALADGDQVMVMTLIPFIYSSAGYNQGQYDENRLLYNAWITSTYAKGATSGVTFCDIGNLPQFQYSFSGYANYRDTATFPHCNYLGYALWAKYAAQQFALNYASQMRAYQPLAMHGGITAAMLPAAAVRTDQSATFSVGLTDNLGGTILNNVGAITTAAGGTISVNSGGIILGPGGGNHTMYLTGAGAGFPDKYGLRDGSNNEVGALFYSATGDTTFGSGAANSNGFSMHGLAYNFVNGTTTEATIGAGGDFTLAGKVNSTAAQTTVSGSTSGSVIFSEPFAGASYKKVIIYMNGLTGTASYTYPVAFTNAPVVVNNDAAATSVSATAITVTGSSTTRNLILEGY